MNVTLHAAPLHNWHDEDIAPSGATQFIPQEQLQAAAELLQRSSPCGSGICYGVNFATRKAQILPPGTKLSTNSEGGAQRSSSTYIGGLDVTCRFGAELERMLPGLAQRIIAERGKIIFLGNGFSEGPLLAAEQHRRENLSEIPNTVDLIDYRLAHSDLRELEGRFKEAHLQFPFSLALANLSSMIQAAALDHLRIVTHCFGSGRVPEELLGASLVVNTFGPPLATRDEQLSLLAPGGELYTGDGLLTQDFGAVDHRFQIADEHGLVIRRVS